jgi:hypothetical protein
LGSEGSLTKQIATAGNTVVPALLALERLGFAVTVERTGGSELFRAIRGDETYVADDPVSVLGLVKLIEERGWTWRAEDEEVEAVLRKYRLG